MHRFSVTLRANLIGECDGVVAGDAVGKGVLGPGAHLPALTVVPAEKERLAARRVVTHQPKRDALRAQEIGLSDAAKVFVTVLQKMMDGRKIDRLIIGRTCGYEKAYTIWPTH